MKMIFDRKLTVRVKNLCRKNNPEIKAQTLSIIIGCSRKSTDDLLNNISPWRLRHIIPLAEYFGVSVDYLIFGAKNFIETHKTECREKILNDVRNYCIDGKHYQIYGKLLVSNFFKDIGLLTNPKN